MKWKTGLLVSLFLLVALTLVMTGFWATGGRSLVNLYFNYLTQDLPDKKYSQADFVERRDETQISGYYAFTLSDNIYIWTLSGLKRYRHLPSNSVYYYMDVCGLIRANGEGRGQGESERRLTLEPTISFDPASWAGSARAGDYVLIKYMRDEQGSKTVASVQGSSNQHYPIAELRREQCQN